MRLVNLTPKSGAYDLYNVSDANIAVPNVAYKTTIPFVQVQVGSGAKVIYNTESRFYHQCSYSGFHHADSRQDVYFFQLWYRCGHWSSRTKVDILYVEVPEIKNVIAFIKKVETRVSTFLFDAGLICCLSRTVRNIIRLLRNSCKSNGTWRALHDGRLLVLTAGH